jgi:periplasmic mercuric ion binding protein
MKLISIIIGLLLTLNITAQKIEDQFTVYGNCGMCKQRIEKAVKATEGVSKAVWNQKTKVLKVKYDSAKTDVNKLHQAVADVGHDTELVRAKDEVYEQLHSCCKYVRKQEE